jgi:chromate reductase
MTTILGISGSLRAGSLNSALLRAADGEMPPGATLVQGTIKGIPLYDGDLEASGGFRRGDPALKAQMSAARGSGGGRLPSTTTSIPAVLKNAIDWLSRPSADIARVFGGRPVAVIGASPGGFGTLLSQTAWLPVLKTLGMQTWAGGRLQVSRAGDAFDANGALKDARVRDQLRAFLAGFVAFAARG